MRKILFPAILITMLVAACGGAVDTNVNDRENEFVITIYKSPD